MIIVIKQGLYWIDKECWGASLEDAYWQTRLDDLVSTVKVLKPEPEEFEELCEELGIEYQYVGDFREIQCVTKELLKELEEYGDVNG